MYKFNGHSIGKDFTIWLDNNGEKDYRTLLDKNSMLRMLRDAVYRNFPVWGGNRPGKWKLESICIHGQHWSSTNQTFSMNNKYKMISENNKNRYKQKWCAAHSKQKFAACPSVNGASDFL